MTLTEKIRLAAEWIAASQRLVVLTGAGVSRESGLPTFRDALDGLWARYSPLQLATPEAFVADPALVWGWYEHRRAAVRRAAPNPAHIALAELEALLPQVVIVTQNVDDLHQRAGSRDIIALHGAIMRSKCFAACRGEPTLVEVEELPDAAEGPPRCPFCGSRVRPDVVWFGENLPAGALQRAAQLAEEADVMLVVGTSGAVQPAASLPFVTYRAGGQVIEINPVASEITAIAALWLEVPAGEALPSVVEAVRALRGEGA